MAPVDVDLMTKCLADAPCGGGHAHGSHAKPGFAGRTAHQLRAEARGNHVLDARSAARARAAWRTRWSRSATFVARPAASAYAEAAAFAWRRIEGLGDQGRRAASSASSSVANTSSTSALPSQRCQTCAAYCSVSMPVARPRACRVWGATTRSPTEMKS